MKLVRVSSPKFTAGFQSNGRVVATHPLLKFMLGWDDGRARSVMRKNGWKATMAREDDVDLLREITCREEYAPEVTTEGIDRGPPRDPDAGLYEHRCHCGKWGAFGFGASILHDRPGTWYCGEHVPHPDRLPREAA